MTLAPTPPNTNSLTAFCDNCGKPKGIRSLTAVCVQPAQSSQPRWLLLCGPCFVDGMT